jgi:hypothetical protein
MFKGLFGTALLHKSQLSFMNFTAEQLSFEVAEFLKVFGYQTNFSFRKKRFGLEKSLMPLNDV